MKKLELLKRIEPLFFDKTYKEVSLQEIADVFQIKKASLYYYFESKEDLFLNLLDFSFNNYKTFLEKSLNGEIRDFIKEFIYYPSISKNFFSVISLNSYCKNPELRREISNKQKEIFEFIYIEINKKYNFSRERTFILLSMLEEIGRKKCLFGECIMNIDDVILEIEKIFK